MRVHEQRYFISFGRKRGEGWDADSYFITDAGRFDNCGLWSFGEKSSAEMCNHAPILEHSGTDVAAPSTRARNFSTIAAIVDGKFMSRGWRKQLRYGSQALGQRRRGEQRVFALTQFAVVEVDGE